MRKKRSAEFNAVVEGLLSSVCQYGDGAEVEPPAGYPFDELIDRFGERLSRVPLQDWACDRLGLPEGSDCLRAAHYLRVHAPVLNASLEVDDGLHDVDASDAAACARLAARAADVAHNGRFQERFGYFAGGRRCIVFANMGGDPAQRLAAEVLRQFLDDAGVRELGVGVSSGDGYTWAVLIDSPDGKRWCEAARKAWLIAFR